jgi:hypothetical protein
VHPLKKERKKLSNSYEVCAVNKRVSMGGMQMLNPPVSISGSANWGMRGLACLPAWEQDEVGKAS